MINLFTARENRDKEKFMYDRIRRDTSRKKRQVYVIVPDQYTLEAEKQAFRYLNEACLFDIEITSLRRFGRKILNKAGLENTPVLTKDGRFMLLYKLVNQNLDQLTVFKSVADKNSYIRMLSDVISDFKQQECSPEEIMESLEATGSHPLLQGKLREVGLILNQYQEAIKGKYVDNEDYMCLYRDLAPESPVVRDSEIWFYGFDTIPPRSIETIVKMAKGADSVNIVVNDTDFDLEKILIRRIEKAAGQAGVEVFAERVGEEYLVKRSPAILRIEKNLFSNEEREPLPHGTGEGEKSIARGLHLVECANQYFEAESAAAYIKSLIRDKNFRMRDISIVSNYPEEGQSIIKRTFREYGLPLFIDERRGISDTQAAVFVTSLLEAVRGGYPTHVMLGIAGNSLSGISRDRWENLENYVRDFNIRGSMWTKPFKYGAFRYSDEEFKRLEETRSLLMDRLRPLEELGDSSISSEKFIDGLVVYLGEVWHFRQNMERLINSQIENGRNEDGERNEGSYNGVLHILEQIREITGDDPLDLDGVTNMMKEGLANTDVGILPPTADGLSMGTVIRTRTGGKRAVVILGANEGVLPGEPGSEGIFSIEDKKMIRDCGFSLGGLDEIKQLEERAALYRAVSKPEEELYISWSLASADGGDSRASSVVDQIRELFPGIKTERDPVQKGFSMELVAGEEEALRHMLNNLKQRPSEKAISENEMDAGDHDLLLHQVMAWFSENRPELMERVMKTVEDDNSREPVGREMAKRLFAKGEDFSFSASRLDKYFSCPFAHFVGYGLRPMEEQEFKSAGREIGDVYHKCIMAVSRELMDRKLHKDSAEGCGSGPYEEKEELEDLVDSQLDKLAGEYKGGLFISGGREKYRMDRIRQVCIRAVEAIGKQLEEGAVTEAFFEEKFGRGCRFQPVIFTLDGQKVYIEGTIDRIDVLDGRNVRIIDYKTGRDHLDLNNMRQGYKLQLMVYMESASGAGSGDSSDKANFQPAGMFYFNIADQQVSATGKDSQKEIEKADSKRFRLQGAYVDQEGIPEMMPREALDKTSAGLTREDFSTLERDVRKEMEKISQGIVSGRIDITPFYLDKNTDGCSFCNYRTICRFQKTNRGNSYRILKKPDKNTKAKKEDKK